VTIRSNRTDRAQYQVTFPEEYVLVSQAEELLRTQASSENPSIQVQNKAQVYTPKDSTDGPTRGGEEIARPDYTYEEMILDDRRLLCQIPRVTDETNKTSSQAEEVDEQKELARATDRGLELLREMEDKCMYYFSGWWSYSFCYRKQIKQFHALAAGRGVPNYPPMEDPNTQSFVLGKFPADASDKEEETQENKQTSQTDVAELHTKGGSRYLVQHLRGGTKCDLTGRDRRVEVQFHCHPQSADQIGWIKELTTCSYLMVIYTPRLCDDLAFMPPQQDEVHDIECREILLPEDVPEWEAVKEWFTSHQLEDLSAAAAQSEPEIQIVGGIVVGGKKLVGMDGKQIEKGRVASAGEERVVDVIAKRENGELKPVQPQVLKKYDLSPERVEEMGRRLEKLAKGRDWSLEVVESDGVIKFQGVVPDDDEAPAQHNEKMAAPQAKDSETTEAKTPVHGAGDDSKSQPTVLGSEAEDEEGSEETFKDEL
jgi:protein OS-9